MLYPREYFWRLLFTGLGYWWSPTQLLEKKCLKSTTSLSRERESTVVIFAITVSIMKVEIFFVFLKFFFLTLNKFGDRAPFRARLSCLIQVSRYP